MLRICTRGNKGFWIWMWIWTIAYNTDISIADTISYKYYIDRSHGENLRYQNQYYVGTKRMPLNWKFLNWLLSLECNYTSIPLHSSRYFSSQKCYCRLLAVVWPFSDLTLQCFDPSSFSPVTQYRPSTPRFEKIGYEIFMAFFYDLCKVWKRGQRRISETCTAGYAKATAF